MYSPVLSIPAQRVSGWVAETDPKYARAWLGSLPLANSAECAREIYQALYTTNRLELRAPARLDLMALYDHAVATVCSGLQSHLLHAVPPLGPKKRQLAEFIRRLHVEMAYGYKVCLRDVSRARLSLRRKSRSGVCIERALYHLSEVLLRSYQVYLPYPAGVWREMHELYRFAETLGIVDATPALNGDGAANTTIGTRYVRTLLLGLINPYQLPHNSLRQVDAFLRQWSHQVLINRSVKTTETSAIFSIDLTADAPPAPLTQTGLSFGTHVRLLDVGALLQTTQGFLTRLQKGGRIESLGLGVDCLDSTCLDLLNRMVRAWGESARRRYARRQRSSNVFICMGLSSLHYFLNGQRSFAEFLDTFESSPLPPQEAGGRDTVVDSNRVSVNVAEHRMPIGRSVGARSHRVDRWRLRDIGPLGMAVARYGDAAAPTRVGDLVGVQQPSDLGRWRAAVIRWVKTPEANSVEAGIEMLAAAVTPVAVRLLQSAKGGPNTFAALRLPATEVVRRPSTLLLPRGAWQVGDELELLEEDAEPRRLQLLRLLERTGSFEQMVYGEIVTRAPKRR